MVWETGVHSQVESYQRLKKMVLDTSLLNTHHYKVHIKGKVGREKSITLRLGVVAIEKGVFESPVYLLVCVYMYVHVYICLYLCVCIYIYVCVCLFDYMCVCVCVYKFLKLVQYPALLAGAVE